MQSGCIIIGVRYSPQLCSDTKATLRRWYLACLCGIITDPRKLALKWHVIIVLIDSMSLDCKEEEIRLQGLLLAAF